MNMCISTNIISLFSLLAFFQINRFKHDLLEEVEFVFRQ